MSHVSMSHHIKSFEVHVNAGGDMVVTTFDYAGMLHLSIEDAQRFYNQLGQVLADIARAHKAEPTPTESGMTELDCALLQANPSREAVTE